MAVVVKEQAPPKPQRKSTMGFWRERKVISLGGMDTSMNYDEESKDQINSNDRSTTLRATVANDLFQAPEGSQ